MTWRAFLYCCRHCCFNLCLCRLLQAARQCVVFWQLVLAAEGLCLRHLLTAVACGCRVPRDQFFQFSWRPRAPTLLPKEQEAEIAKHLKDYSKRYDEIDSKLLQEVCRSCKVLRCRA